MSKRIHSTMYVPRFGGTECEIGVAADVSGARGKVDEVQLMHARCHHCGEEIPVEKLSPAEWNAAERAILDVIEEDS